jgi:hypothetical protein
MQKKMRLTLHPIKRFSILESDKDRYIQTRSDELEHTNADFTNQEQS